MPLLSIQTQLTKVDTIMNSNSIQTEVMEITHASVPVALPGSIPHIVKTWTQTLEESFSNFWTNVSPPGHQLHKLLNRNTVKLSYSCMPNFKEIISDHNKSVLSKCQPKPYIDPHTCNCRDDSNCPLENKCLTSGIIYQATVTRQDINHEETYVGLTENIFKTRYNGHMSSFRNIENRHATTLSEHIWTLKDNKVPYSIKWKILSRAKAYSTSHKLCNLCIEEKYFIRHRPDLSSLNKRNELMGACRHRKKHLLCNYK